MTAELTTVARETTTPHRFHAASHQLTCVAAPFHDTTLGGPGDMVGQQSFIGELAGFRLQQMPQVDPHGWLGPLVSTAPAVRAADGVEATAHVVLESTDRPLRKRFHAEATGMRTALSGVNSPFVANLLDHAVAPDGQAVLFTTRFGKCLADRGPLPLERMLDVASDAAAGLAAVHHAGELHRAVSPAALLCRPDDRIQLSIPALPVLAELVVAGDGTGHEPPEVLAGGDWTVAADMYALAATLWTLLGGTHDKPPRMSRSDIPAAVVSVLADAMAADPADRPTSPRELVALLNEASAPAGPAATQDTVPPKRQNLVEGKPLGSGYWLVAPIGSGSTGTVFRARRLEDGTILAAKLLRPELVGDRDAEARFLGERAVLTELAHPNIVKVHDLIVERGEMAIVMDLVDGPDLRQLINTRSIARADGLRLLSQVAAALSAAHARDVIHRDVKPENVLVTGTGSERTALLTDFGLAKVRGRPTITQQYALLGTMAYVAPELAAGKKATAACDVYAWGVTCYEFLAGHRPFHADEVPALLHAHLTQAPPRPRGVSDQEWMLLSGCLAKDPAARPTATQLVDMLASLASAQAFPAHETPTAIEFTTSDWLPTAHASAPATALTTEQLDLPSAAVEHPAEVAPQPTMAGTRPPAAAPEPAETSRRRRWPLVTAILATAAAGAAVGVWLALPEQTPDGPAYRPIPVEAIVEDGGAVRLYWSPEVEKLPGFQSYSILRNGQLVEGLSPGDTSYRDPDAGADPCYTVLALGVPRVPSDPSPPSQCPKR